MKQDVQSVILSVNIIGLRLEGLSIRRSRRCLWWTYAGSTTKFLTSKPSNLPSPFQLNLIFNRCTSREHRVLKILSIFWRGWCAFWELIIWLSSNKLMPKTFPFGNYTTTAKSSFTNNGRTSSTKLWLIKYCQHSWYMSKLIKVMLIMINLTASQGTI